MGAGGGTTFGGATLQAASHTLNASTSRMERDVENVFIDQCSVRGTLNTNCGTGTENSPPSTTCIR